MLLLALSADRELMKLRSRLSWSQSRERRGRRWLDIRQGQNERGGRDLSLSMSSNDVSPSVSCEEMKERAAGAEVKCGREETTFHLEDLYEEETVGLAAARPRALQ